MDIYKSSIAIVQQWIS